MITRLEVDGFKSLRDFAVDLEPFTVLVGPNDAGKSNILEALALASRLGRMNPEEALQHGRGLATDQFWRHGSSASPRLSLALECLEPDAEHHGENGDLIWASRLRYEISLERTSRAPRVERITLRESTKGLRANEDRWLMAHPEWQAHIPELPTREQENGFLPDCLPNFHLIQLDTAHLREPSQRIDSGELSPDASNLPSVLAGLSDVALGAVRAALVALIPGISDFDIVQHDERLHIEFRTREGEKIPARLASDGTLRALALLTAVLARPASSWDAVICIEEPENGIYPGRLARLIDILRDTTDSAPWRDGETVSPPPQVIITTHSPIVMATLQRHRETIRLVDLIRRDGMRFTRARRIVEDVTDRMTEASVREIELLLHTFSPEEGR